MKKLVLLATMFMSLTVTAQQAPVNSPLLDHLAGKWLLQGTVGKQAVTHDFDAEWVLQHHYLRFREVSREKNDKGEPQYDATVFIAWNEKTKQYACVWLDVYGGPQRNPSGSPRLKRMNLLSSSPMSTVRPASPTPSPTTPRPTPGTTGSTT